MPDISKINNVEVANISKLDAVTFAHGQKVNNQSVALVTDARVLIQEEVDFTNETTVCFDTSGSYPPDYDVFMFQFINIHSNNNDVQFRFASSVSTDYNWAVYWNMYQEEDGTDGAAGYVDAQDTLLNANTPYATIAYKMGSVGDESLSGYLTMYGLHEEVPRQQSKVWMTKTSHHGEDNYHRYTQNSGRIIHDGSNSNDSVDQIVFSMSGGTFDGTIRLFGMALS